MSEIPPKIGWRWTENKLAGLIIGNRIKSKMPIATSNVKELAKRLPSRFINTLAFKNKPNIKATIPKGIKMKRAISGIMTISLKK